VRRRASVSCSRAWVFAIGSSPEASSCSSSARRRVSCSRCSLMRLTPTAIELSAARRDSTRTCRSRAASCPAGASARAVWPAARRVERRVPLLALLAKCALALLELGGQCPRARQLRRGPGQRLHARRALVRHLAGVLPQPLAPQPRFLGVGTACLEQAEQTCVF